MKKWKNFLLIGAVCTLFALPVHAAENDLFQAEPIPTEAPTITPEPIVTPQPEKKNGWVTLKDGIRKRYYKDGVLLKGMQKINGKTYYFFKNSGTMATKWRTLNGKKYYFGTNGVRREGLVKIDKKYYFFNSKGILQTGTVKANGKTYYLTDEGVAEAKKIGSAYYHPNGRPMTKTEGYEYETLLRARKIVSQVTTSSMSQSQKLEKCFRWVMSKYYKTVRPFTKPDGWIALYANDHFLNGRGNCFSDACAFAYLAKALGYKEVYVCVDSRKTDGTGSGHSWAEINGLVYDPLFAEAKSFSRHYGVTYGVYPLSPLIKEAV